jgi:hypothetical protein
MAATASTAAASSAGGHCPAAAPAAACASSVRQQRRPRTEAGGRQRRQHAARGRRQPAVGSEAAPKLLRSRQVAIHKVLVRPQAGGGGRRQQPRKRLRRQLWEAVPELLQVGVRKGRRRRHGRQRRQPRGGHLQGVWGGGRVCGGGSMGVLFYGPATLSRADPSCTSRAHCGTTGRHAGMFRDTQPGRQAGRQQGRAPPSGRRVQPPGHHTVQRQHCRRQPPSASSCSALSSWLPS